MSNANSVGYGLQKSKENSTKKLEIVEIYQTKDKNYHYDPIKVLFYIDDQLVISGDFFHNSMDDQIVGVKATLSFLQIEYEQIRYRIADSGLPHEDDILDKARNYDSAQVTKN